MSATSKPSGASPASASSQRIFATSSPRRSRSDSSKSTPRTIWAPAGRRMRSSARCANVTRCRFTASGLSIGSMAPLDRDHLARLKILCDRYEPESFSEHLAWSSHDGVYFNDLLPLPYTQQTLARVAEHIDEVQTRARTPDAARKSLDLCLFRPKARSRKSTSSAKYRSGPDVGCCSMSTTSLSSAKNHAVEPLSYLDSFPLDRVKEIHLGGHDEEVDDAGAPLLIDSHGSPIANAVWALYAQVIARTGAIRDLDRMGQRRSGLADACARKRSRHMTSLPMRRGRRRPERDHVRIVRDIVRAGAARHRPADTARASPRTMRQFSRALCRLSQ